MAAYDVEGETAHIGSSAWWRRRRAASPPCGDDPVLWYAMHANRPTRAQWITNWMFNLVGIGFIAFATWRFAKPAFQELASRGYGAEASAVDLPDVNPFARDLINSITPGSLPGPSPGQARLEFAIALRQFSSILALLCAFGIIAAASSSVTLERKRDTWLGLIATPLSGWEILRAKLPGALWYARGYFVTLIALWTVGLPGWRLHPVGFLAGLAELAVTKPHSSRRWVCPCRSGSPTGRTPAGRSDGWFRFWRPWACSSCCPWARSPSRRLRCSRMKIWTAQSAPVRSSR